MYKDLDFKIIAELRKDARSSSRQIGIRLGISTATVAGRIREMEKNGIIRGFRPLIDYRKIGFGITAVTLIKAVGGKIPSLMKDLMADPQLTHVYEITGEFDLLVIGKFKNTDTMNRQIKKLLSHKAIKETSTAIVLGPGKEELMHPKGTELKKKSSERVFHGRIFDVIVDEIEYPSGNSGVREVVRHPGGAAVVALRENNRILLVRQLRYPYNERVAELPAGKLDGGEDPDSAARRELLEETGYIAEKWDKLTAIYPSPGYCNETIHIYLARGLKQAEAKRTIEEGEMDMVVEEVDLGQALDWVMDGTIRDSKTIIGLLLTEKRLSKQA